MSWNVFSFALYFWQTPLFEQLLLNSLLLVILFYYKVNIVLRFSGWQKKLFKSLIKMAMPKNLAGTAIYL